MRPIQSKTFCSFLFPSGCQIIIFNQQHGSLSRSNGLIYLIWQQVSTNEKSTSNKRRMNSFPFVFCIIHAPHLSAFLSLSLPQKLIISHRTCHADITHLKENKYGLFAFPYIKKVIHIQLFHACFILTQL